MSTVFRERIIRPESIERMSEPVSATLERALLDYCARPHPYRIEAFLQHEDIAPDDFGALLSALAKECDHIEGVGTIKVRGSNVGIRVPVSATWCACTIWSGTDAHALFRAAHDAQHVELADDFTMEGEVHNARVMARRLSLSWDDRALLHAEIAGQVAYYYSHGTFPDDARGFVLACVANGPAMLADTTAQAIASARFHDGPAFRGPTPFRGLPRGGGTP